MERKVTLSILLITITFIVCLVLNFPDALMGNAPTIRNAIITFVFVSIWIFVFFIVLRNKNQAVMKFFLLFWLVTLFFAVLTALANGEIIDATWATAFIALLITPWYGIELLTDDFLITAIIISIISVLFIFSAGLSLAKSRRT